jgi:hypothetical protein
VPLDLLDDVVPLQTFPGSQATLIQLENDDVEWFPGEVGLDLALIGEGEAFDEILPRSDDGAAGSG